MKLQIPAALLIVLVLSIGTFADEGDSIHRPLPAPGTSGSGTIPFTATGIVLLGWLPLSTLDAAANSGSSCWGYTSPSGREYAIIGVSSGTAFVEITDPGRPVLVSLQPGPSSLWRELKTTSQGYAYVVSEGGSGIQVFNLSEIDAGIVTHVTDVTTGGCTEATHTISVNEATGFLYRNGGSSTPCTGGKPQGLVIYSLADPANPSFVAHWNTRYVHDSQVVVWNRPGTFFGKELAFCATNNGSSGGSPAVTILDVTDKAAITVVRAVSYPQSGYAHQGWLSEDQRYFYLDDELDETSFGTNTTTRIFDVSNPSGAFLLGTFSAGTTSIDHNLFVKGNLLFEANYTSGLRLFDITIPTAPVQIAWFDTYPDSDAATFNSLWGNYPFFPSGTVIGSDLEKGLFVWYIGIPKLTFDFPNGLPELVAPNGDEFLFEVHEQNLGDLEPGSVEFHVDTGTGFTTIPATSQGAELYSATLPPLACGNEARYFVSARSTGGSGITWTDPPAGPTQFYTTTVAFAEDMPFFDDVEIELGWTAGVPGDTATTGIWERVNPIGTAAQPEDDHTPDPGVFAWVTGQGTVGGSVGENDVDDGETTLLSPIFNAAGLSDPFVSYWRWYSNNQVGPPDDTFLVDLSNDGGVTWTSLEVLGPTGPDTVGGWIQHSSRISDFVLPTSQMQLRFVAQDENASSIIEAAVDDVQVFDFICNVAVDSVVPAEGPFQGGNTVTIFGDGFVDGLTTVEFEGLPSPPVTVISRTELQAEVPQRFPPRLRSTQLKSYPSDVTVTTGLGTDTFDDGYAYVFSAGPTPNSLKPLRILVPAYFYPLPGSPWDRLNAAAASHPGNVAAIGNPFNGPGLSLDPIYLAAFQDFRAQGGMLFGYVATSYGNRPVAEVEQDIQTWFDWYPIDGIFLDEMDNTPGANESYYQSLTQFTRTLLPDAPVVGNPGTSTSPSYLRFDGAPVVSTLCIHEDGANFLAWTAQAWVRREPRRHFLVLPYAVSSMSWRAVVDHAISQNCGWIYVTDDVLPNPWDTLPSYFEKLVDYVTPSR